MGLSSVSRKKNEYRNISDLLAHIYPDITLTYTLVSLVPELKSWTVLLGYWGCEGKSTSCFQEALDGSSAGSRYVDNNMYHGDPMAALVT